MVKNVISVIDGAAGSCGKAKVIGEIATNKEINLGAAISNCMPNAGHSFVDENGHKTIFRNIPVSIVNHNCELFIGPGSAIDMDTFIEEYEIISKYLNNREIYVHELVPLIEQKHKDYERKTLKSGSTFKGCGAVSSEKVMRNPELKFFKGYKNAHPCSNDEWLERLYKHLDNESEYVMLEGTQGTDLSLNHSGNYPYVTSRNISTAQLLADSGISPERLLQTIMVIRPFPIRISNITTTGEYIYTGAYGNGSELTWTQINLASSNNTYPFIQDIDEVEVDIDNINYLLKEASPIHLKQLFGTESISIENITTLQALELERLINKAKGLKEYKSIIIDEFITDQSEQTTVTKMERRIFDLDINKLKNNCRINTPSSLYLNFFQELCYEYANVVGEYNDIYLDRYLREYINYIESSTGIDISALGTGAKNGECILKKQLIKNITK